MDPTPGLLQRLGLDDVQLSAWAKDALSHLVAHSDVRDITELRNCFYGLVRLHTLGELADSGSN